MTSYCEPNYQFVTTQACKIKVSCMWFGELKRQNKKYPLKALLLLYSNLSNKLVNGDIWLMANNAKISTNEKVIFTLKSIDPAWHVQKYDTEYLQAYIGLSLSGELKPNGANAL